jgi:L-fuculose-phosphate aldolase
MDSGKAKSRVIRASHELVERGLVARTWGNVSCRIDETSFAVTPSGIGYDRLTSDEIVVVDITTLEYQGEVEPSSERGIHAAAYRIDPACDFVIHTHQTAASVIGAVGFDEPALAASLELSAETREEWGGIGCAGYGLPGTKRLMNNVVRLLEQGKHTILMERHGALAAAASSRQAFSRAMALEAACERLVPECRLLSATGPKALSVCSDKTDDKSRSIGGKGTHEDGGTAGKGVREGGGAGGGNGSVGKKGMDTLHAVIREHCPGYRAMAQFDSPIVEMAVGAGVTTPDVLPSEAPATSDTSPMPAGPVSVSSIPAMLDDFAQMGGLAMPVLPGDDPRRIAAALRRRNCAYVRGEGLLCCATDASDCEALRALAEKNALTFLVARRFGAAKALSLFDRLLMRRVYLTRYSKKN